MSRPFLYATRNLGRFAIKIGPYCLIAWRHRGTTVGRWDCHITEHRKLRLPHRRIR